MKREGVWELPAGWDTAPLCRLVDIQSGFACSKKNLVPASVGVAHLRPFNVGTDGRVDLSEVYYIPPDFKDNVEDYALEPGHVLFNNTNSVELVGKTALVTEPMRCAFSNHIYRLALQEKAQRQLEPAWLALALRRLWAMGYFAERCNRWIGQAGFNATRLKEVEIPLPPLDEQRRIVARIEALFERIAEARRLRTQAGAETEAVVNSELASIFGELVGRNGTRRLGDLVTGARYGTSVKCSYDRVEGSVPVLRIPNVKLGRMSFEDMKYGTLTEGQLEDVLVDEGDILVVRTCGSADLVGRCAVVSAVAEPTAFASYLIRLRCDPQVVSPAYLQFMLEHLRVDGQLFDLARTSAGQYNVSATRLRVAHIPVPPLSEQCRIVEYLDGVQAQAAELNRLQTASAAELARLEGAVLARAFRGEL